MVIHQLNATKILHFILNTPTLLHKKINTHIIFALPYPSPFHYSNTSKSVFSLNYRCNKNIFFKFVQTPIRRVITEFRKAISN